MFYVPGENSHLITECNLLRRENLSLSREVNHLRQLVKDHTAAAAKRRHKCRSRNEDKSVLAEDEDAATSTASPRTRPLNSVLLAPSADVSDMHVCARDVRDCKMHLGLRYRGSTRTLNQLSVQEAKIVKMATQLDVNMRIIDTQRMQIKALRDELQKTGVNAKIPKENSHDLGSTRCYEAPQGTHVILECSKTPGTSTEGFRP